MKAKVSKMPEKGKSNKISFFCNPMERYMAPK
jgi:hypothetical protein